MPIWPQQLFSREAEFFIPTIILGKGCWGGFPGGVRKLMRMFSYVNTYTLFRHAKKHQLQDNNLTIKLIYMFAV